MKNALRLGHFANRLELEITVSVLLRDDVQTVTTLHKLRARGVRIASTISAPPSPRSVLPAGSFPFIPSKSTAASYAICCKKRIALQLWNQSLALRASYMSSVVEGVEIVYQLERAMDAGCDEVEGDHFNRPVP